MTIGILKEAADKRVAIVPDTVKKLKGLDLNILVESQAGAHAFFTDAEYEEAGAGIAKHSDILKKADVIISITPLEESELKGLEKGKTLISQFQPFFDKEVADRLNGHGLQAFSLDMIPRTTLAQSMDVLSSMASIAGYQAVLEAARHLPRYFPMMITAAGSIRPAKVLILGAGVAGLQAIATARRLGAQVEAFDTRSAAREEVKSLGAKFIEIEGAAEDTGAGGYAVEQSEEFLKRQREEVQNRASKSDIIITTAQVRGRKAPLLVPKTTVDKMRTGSVIVDLAASTGGNCELTQNDQVVQHNGVTIVGDSNLAALLPQDASFLYSNNLFNFFKILVKDGQLHLDMDNEIVSGALITTAPEKAEISEQA